MRAVTWHGRADVRVDTVPDPVLEEELRTVTDPASERSSQTLKRHDVRHVVRELVHAITKAAYAAGARYVELPGEDHLYYAGDADAR